VQDEAFELIRFLVETMVVTPADGELRSDLQGEQWFVCHERFPSPRGVVSRGWWKLVEAA
jgi:hypothetical protein